jgi:hypothetical protein
MFSARKPQLAGFFLSVPANKGRAFILLSFDERPGENPVVSFALLT